MKKIIIISAAITAIVSSCTKVIDLNLEQQAGTIVIEGEINDKPGPYFVKINKSVTFDQSSIFPPVANAQVVISDNTGQRDTLTYTSNGIYKSNTLQGINGNSYTLEINAEGKQFKAMSTMPKKITLDTLVENLIQTPQGDRKIIVPIYFDGMELGNNYRKLLTINGKLDKNISVDNDNINNGKPNQRPIFSPTAELKTGDTVSVELQCIDKNVFDYYFTLSNIAGQGPGGGTTPSNPPNNISNNALGIFSANSSSTKTIIIK